MNPEIIREIIKGGIGMVLAVGLIVILYKAVADDKAADRFLHEHMARQTAALEELVATYTGQRFEARKWNINARESSSTLD